MLYSAFTCALTVTFCGVNSSVGGGGAAASPPIAAAFIIIGRMIGPGSETSTEAKDSVLNAWPLLSVTAFANCFVGWMNAVCERCGLKGVQVDGKTLRGSGSKDGLQTCLHLVSVWAQENGLTLGQEAVESHSDEIPAVPRLLETLELAGAIVTIDAMGCQKEIAAKVREQKGDYVLAVKGNQPTLHEDVAACFDKACEAEASFSQVGGPFSWRAYMRCVDDSI